MKEELEALQDRISVLAGNLGRMILEEERRHWKFLNASSDLRREVNELYVSVRTIEEEA